MFCRRAETAPLKASFVECVSRKRRHYLRSVPQIFDKPHIELMWGLFYMFLTLILIALFPLSAAEQNEINPKNEEKLFER